jgi:D-aspartate ligase
VDVGLKLTATGVVPALVLGSGITAVGVVRSLGVCGIPVHCVCGPGELPAKSRWYRPAPLLSSHVPLPGELQAYLASLPMEAAVLIPCSDDWGMAVAAMPEDLKRRFPASVPSPRVMETMTDKWLFAQMVERAGVPRPRTLLVHSVEEMEALPESCYEEMFLKPVNSLEFAVRTRVKAFRFENKPQALAIMRTLTAQHGPVAFPILLQQYIPGPATQHYLVDGFVDRQGRTRGWFARRRLRMYPPDFGNSSYSETIPLSEVADAVESMERIWAEVEFRGIFDAEFKYDPRDGQYKIIEINARPWWFVEFATRCGVNLCLMAYRDALELPVERSTGFEVGRRCVHVAVDLAGHLELNPGIVNFFRWVRSLRGAEEAIYRKDDRLPGIWSPLMLAESRVRNVCKAVLQRVRR